MQCRCKNSYTKVRTDIALFSLFGLSCKIHVRENRRGNQEWTTQRNYQHNVHKTKTISTTKTTQYVLDTTLRKTYTNNVNKTWAFLQTIRDKDEPNIVDITTIFRTIDFLTDIAFRFWWMSRWLVLHITVAVLGLLCAVCRTIDFLANIVNFPFICINNPASPVYRLYISQLIRYSRSCDSFHNFLDCCLQGSYWTKSSLGWALWNICHFLIHALLPGL